MRQGAIQKKRGPDMVQKPASEIRKPASEIRKPASETRKPAAGREPRFKRVLLKISGEALMGEGDYGLELATVNRIAQDVKDALKLGVQVCLVIGGGNIFRGVSGAAVGM